MDTLQKQIAALNVKVDALHQLIEQLSQKLTDGLSEAKMSIGQANQRSASWSRYPHGHRGLDEALEHKDVLSDFASPESSSQSGERLLSPEIQIQRLTAQLTAAYNRIAALEEQLLSQRIH